MLEKIQEIKNQLTHFEYIDCPLCGETYKNTRTLFTNDKGLSDHKRICKKCGLIYQSPRWTQNDTDRFYNEFYLSHYFEEINDDGFNGAKRHYECGLAKSDEVNIFYDEIKRAKNPIEIGCSSGGVLKALTEINSNFQGIDIDSNAIKFAQEKGLNAEYKSLFSLEDNTYDFILMSHVVEHLLQPDVFFKKIHDILVDGGQLLIFVPDSYKMHEAPHVPHTFCFSDKTLISMLNKAGFSVQRNIINKERKQYRGDLIILFQKTDIRKWELSTYNAIKFYLYKFKRLIVNILEKTNTKKLIIKLLNLDKLDTEKSVDTRNK